jgi:hypothetical protein
MQSHYKLTDDDMEEITKEWPTEFLVSVEKIEIFDPDIIKIPLVTRTEYDLPSNTKRKKKKEEVQDIYCEEKNIASEKTLFDSPAGGGGGELNQEEEGEEDKQDKGELTSLKDPLTEDEMSKKRKDSLQKPSAQKKSRTTKPQS